VAHVVAGLAALAGTAHAAPGQLDPSFGAGRGFVTTDVIAGGGAVDQADALAVGPFGDAYVAGTSFQPGGPLPETLTVAHYNCCGLDSTFGVGGTVAARLGEATTGRDIVFDDRGDGVVANDRLLVAGSITRNGVQEALVLALPRDGRGLDRSWNGEGFTAHGVPGGTRAQLVALARERSGRVVAVGNVTISGARRGFVARYASDGRLDRSFSDDGVRVLSVARNGAAANAVSLADVAFDAARDRILAVGSATFAGSDAAADEQALAFALRGADASLDRGFNGNGARLQSLATGDDRATAVALQPDGRAVLAGVSDPTGTGGDTGVVTARLRTDGSLDPDYSRDGRTFYRPRTPARDVGATDVAVHGPTGQITLTAFDRGGSASSDDDDTFTLLRYTPAGGRDPAFGTGGEVRTNLNPGVGGFEVATAVGLRRDGSVIAAGTSVPAGSFEFAVAVYRNT
jgi:uncharacterized delta-60 repeat protein